MDSKMRKELAPIVEQLCGLSGAAGNRRDDQQEKFDELPERSQESEKGEALGMSAQNLDYAVNAIEEAIDYIEQPME
jgi:hypothetical protein